jgi:hypothetical protein
MNQNDPLELLKRSEGFDWDINNYYKNWIKHGVTAEEAQQVFGNQPLFAYTDLKHSQSEPRFLGYGQTNAGTRLLISYTFRNNRVRVISARRMSLKEREVYEQASKGATTL